MLLREEIELLRHAAFKESISVSEFIRRAAVASAELRLEAKEQKSAA